MGNVKSGKQPGQRVIDENGRDDGEQIWNDRVRRLNIGHGPRVIVQPGFAKERIPAEADEEVNDNEKPDSEMMDPVSHNALRLSD